MPTTYTYSRLLALLDEAIESGQRDFELRVRELLDSGDYLDPAPVENRAEDWDDWRLRQGYAGGHH